MDDRYFVRNIPRVPGIYGLCCTKRADLRWNLETSQALELNLR